MKRNFLIVVLMLCTAPLLHAQTPHSQQLDAAQGIEVLYSVYRDINLYYVDSVAPTNVVRDAASGMLTPLDPYSEYISKEDVSDFEFTTTGKYGGIGSLIRQRNEWVEISEPYKDSPADIAGLKAGDRLLEIDGESLRSLGSAKVSSKLKGDPGTSFTLVYRPLSDTTTIDTITIKRQRIAMPAVPYYGMVGDSIGYINFNSFTKGGAGEIKNAYLTLKEQNTLNSLILDLRDNGGGLVTEAIDILSLFLEKGTEVLSIRGKSPDSNSTYTTKAKPLDLEIPIVVLINSASASASEIVAGALQDLDRAVVMGQRSFGKGLVQSTRGLPYGGMLKLTTGKYYTPSGRCIQALDYSNRKEDGSVGHIPDSLIQGFKTKGGRTVYNGGGIMPDIKSKREKYSRFTGLVMLYSFVDDFASEWAAHNNPTKEEFKVDDALYTQFIDYMQDKELKYESITAIKLKELRDVAKDEELDSLIENELDLIAKKIHNDKNEELLKYKDELSEMLTYSILTRLFYREYAIENSIPNDPTVKKAKELLKDSQEYQRILKEQDTQKN